MALIGGSMDYTTNEARKYLRDYYNQYWHDYYEKRWTESDNKLLGLSPSTSFHEAVDKMFGYEPKKSYHKNIDYSLYFRKAMLKGILTAPSFRDHDEVIGELLKLQKSMELSDVVNGFLYSLSTGKNQYRTALASYLFAKNLTKHSAEAVRLPGRMGTEKACPVCGMEFDKDGKCHIEDSFSRYALYYPQKDTIGLIQRADYALFDLKQFRELPKVTYSNEDISLLVSILKLAESMAEHNNYTALQKLITRSKMIHATGNEINVILGVLSVCGVLQTPEQRGFSEKYTPIGDWGFQGIETELFYPLFFWRGKHGVDRKALADIFPASVLEALDADSKDVSMNDIYGNGKDDKSPVSRAESAFTEGIHIIELDNRMRHCYGLADLDPAWHKEVRFSVTHNSHKRTEVYFDGNTIRKTIFECRSLNKDGTFSAGMYVEKDLCVETEDRFLILPKTPRGKKKPWTPSLLDQPTYAGPTLTVNFGGYIFAVNWKNGQSVALPVLSKDPEKQITSQIAFYTYTEEYMKYLSDQK